MNWLTPLRAGLTVRPFEKQATPAANDPRRQINVGLERQARRVEPENMLSDDRQDAAELQAITSAWVYRNLVLLGNRTSEAGLEVKQREGEQLSDQVNHPLEQLLSNPNSLMDGAFLRAYTNEWWWLRGEAFVFIATPGIGRGEPEELWPMPANLVVPLPHTLRTARNDPGRKVIDYAYYPDFDTTPITLPGENVIHFRFPNLWNYWRGLAPLTAYYLSLETDRAQAQWLRNWYQKENARPAVVASTAKDLTDIEFNKAREAFFEKFAGGTGTAFTRAGDLTIDVVQQTVEQMKILEARTSNRDEIDAVFGTQDIHNAGGSGDSRNAAESLFAANTLQPHLNKEARAFTTFLARPYYGDDIMVVAENTVPRDIALETQQYNILAPDRTIAENRAEQDLPELEGIPEPLRVIVESVPTRLIGPLKDLGRLWDMEATLPAPTGNGGGEPEPEVGSMANMDTPENSAEEESARSTALLDRIRGNAKYAPLFEVQEPYRGFFVAIWLDADLSENLALPGGEPPEDLHITLCYCGDAGDMGPVGIAEAITVVGEVAERHGTMDGVIGGMGRFNASESSDGKDVVYANVDVPGLETLRQDLADALTEAGYPPSQNHGYTPHVTLAYVDPGAPLPVEKLPTYPITVRSIWVSVSERRAEIPLSGQPTKEVDVEAAITEAQRADLKRWRKVALKELEAGRASAERVFESEVLPQEMQEAIVKELKGAGTVDDVKGVFGGYLEPALPPTRETKLVKMVEDIAMKAIESGGLSASSVTYEDFEQAKHDTMVDLLQGTIDDISAKAWMEETGAEFDAVAQRTVKGIWDEQLGYLHERAPDTLHTIPAVEIAAVVESGLETVRTLAQHVDGGEH